MGVGELPLSSLQTEWYLESSPQHSDPLFQALKYVHSSSQSLKMVWYVHSISPSTANVHPAPKDCHTIDNAFVRAKNSIKGKTYLGRVGTIWPINPLSTPLRKEHELSNGTLSKARRKQGRDKGFQKPRSYLQFCAGAQSHRTLGVEP